MEAGYILPVPFSPSGIPAFSQVGKEASDLLAAQVVLPLRAGPTAMVDHSSHNRWVEYFALHQHEEETAHCRLVGC